MKTLTTLSVAIMLSLTAQVSMARPHAPPQDAANAQFGGQTTRQDARQQARVDQMLSQFDLNQDGQIGQDEVQSILTDEFSKLDTDSDGFVSFAEFQQAAPPTGPGMHHGGRMPPVGGCATTDTTATGTTTTDTTTDSTTTTDTTTTTTDATTTATTAGCQPPAGALQHQQARFTRLDTDGDGQISKAEFIANLPLFDQFDCDEDGVITQTELLSKPCQAPQATQ